MPTSEDDVMVSLILARDKMEPGQLNALIDSVKAGNKLVLDEPPDSEMRKAARWYLSMMGRRSQGRPTQNRQGRSTRLKGERREREPSGLLPITKIRALGFGVGLIPTIIMIAVVAVLAMTGTLRVNPAASWHSFFLQMCPPAMITFLYAALNICRFENQRWTRLSTRGSSPYVDLIIDTSGNIAWLFSWAWLIAFLFDFEWQQTIGLMLVSQLAVLGWSLFSRDHYVLCFVATALSWLLIVALGASVSWFALVAH